MRNMAYIIKDPVTGKHKVVYEGRGPVEKALGDGLWAEARERDAKASKGKYPPGSVGAWRRRR